MKIIGVIPARYSSTRFPGKPLADIFGKPMLWWVYNKVKSIGAFSDVVCAIDDERIVATCERYDMKHVMTRNDHPNHISRVHEVAERIESDYYVCINGDEPLISEECILPVLPHEVRDYGYFCGAMRILTDPAETLDFAKIKVIVTKEGRCLYMSRSPIPYPRGTLAVEYKKYVGVECFNRQALDFFVSNPMGEYEKIEDIDHLRFLENGMPLYFKKVQSESISVDTPKDLEKVKAMLKKKIESNEILYYHN